MNHRSIISWLSIVCLLILIIVFVGGMTRLTGSGLSMVRWELFMGMKPPLSQADWEQTFDDYKDFPEYQKLRPNMTLDEFKVIFSWEYSHRMLGRVVGLVYLFGYLTFLIRRRLTKPLAWKLLFGFLLLSFQGFLGWFMVKSGLKENPYVSHYRLAAHLIAAFSLFAFLVWLILDLLPADEEPSPDRRLFRLSGSITGLILLQIVYGAFVAGLKAGYMFNTFPTMHGFWIPPNLLDFDPVWQTWFANPLTVQFVHRSLAWLLLLVVPLFWLYTRFRSLSPQQTLSTGVMAGIVLVQFILGVMTLVLHVPIGLAAMHQLTACLLFGSAIWVMHSFAPHKDPSP
ncbi:MAG: COX15/CtaA family protein [Verrucomicrobiota bacterium]